MTPDFEWDVYRDPEWYEQYNLPVVPQSTAMQCEPIPEGIDEDPP